MSPITDLPCGRCYTERVSPSAKKYPAPRDSLRRCSFSRPVNARWDNPSEHLALRGDPCPRRALAVNLPQPTALTYPIFDSTGSVFQDGYYTVDLFSTWQFTRTLECPWPRCINPLGRPIAELGAINEFQSAASSYYNGPTLSVNRRVARGTYMRLAYTYARHR